MARVFVAVDSDLGVIGFYSLSSFALAINDLPEEIVRRLPRYDAVPAALVGRLARDLRVRGRGVGDMLVADAIRRILDAGRSLAVFGIVVDAKDERARAFYESFGFTPFVSRPLRLYLPIAAATKAFQRTTP